MGSGASKNQNTEDYESSQSSGITKKKIRSIKRINPNDDIKKTEETEDRNKKKLKELHDNDDFNTNHPDYHEYMFFSMKNGDIEKNKNLEVLLKTKKKKQKQLYTFEQEEDTRKKNELAQILHIDYDLDKPKYPYSIKKVKCDKPPVNNDYLVIEYNLHKYVESDKDDDEEDNSDEDHKEDNSHKSKSVHHVKYGLTSRVVHTNKKNCKISNYVYTKQNGERYDFIDMNKDPNQIRKLKIKKDDDDEEKRVNEKEENQDRFINKNKKGNFRCKKMF
jgi:hypothetical protein